MTKALFNLKIDEDVREEFKLVAALRGATMSSLVHQYAFQVIREEQERCPAAFIYLSAGGSIDNAVKIAREFGKRPISDEDRADIRKRAETEREEALRLVRIESREDLEDLVDEINDGGPFVKKIKKDQPLQNGDPPIEKLRPFKPKKGKKT